jgi:mannosyltransferase
MRRWLILLFCGALALRLLLINADLLWYDEAFTALIVRRPFLDMLQAIRGDVHPPLWYAIAWLFAQVGGNSSFVLRLPSALLGTLSVMQIWQLVKRFAGEKPALWAAGLMTIAPGQLYYSQEARMYALLTLLVGMAAYAVSSRNWLRLGLCCSLILYTHNLGWLYVSLLGAWGLWTSRGAALKSLAIGAVAYLPWLPSLIGQATQLSQGFWLSPRPSLGSAMYWISYTTMFVRLPDRFIIHGITASLIVTAVALFGLRKQLGRLAPMLSLSFLPPGLLYTVSMIWHPVILDRALLPAGAMLIGLWGIGLSQLAPWGKRALAMVGVPMALVGLLMFYQNPTGQRARTDPVREIVADGWKAGDVVYNITLETDIINSYYLADRPAYVLPEAGDLSQSLSDQTKVAMGMAERAVLFSQLRRMGFERAWLFTVVNPLTSEYEINQSHLILSNYATIKSWHFSDDKITYLLLSLVDLSHAPAIMGS